MRTFHSILDVNNDGIISYDDFQLVARNFASLGHLKPDAQNEFNEVMKQVWETLFGEITPYNLVNAEQYLTEMHNILNDKKQREKVHSFLPFLFKVNRSMLTWKKFVYFDTGHDGPYKFSISLNLTFLSFW